MKILFIVILSVLLPAQLISSDYEIKSPNGKIVVTITVSEKISAEIYLENKKLFALNDLMIDFEEVTDGKIKVKDFATSSITNILKPAVRIKSSEITEQYNQGTLTLKGKLKLSFRVYNEGVAYRFETGRDEELFVYRESLQLSFPDKTTTWFPTEQSFMSHNERYYDYLFVDSIPEGNFCSLPVLFKLTDGENVLVSESDLMDYPGMWLQKNKTSLTSIFPYFPEETKLNRDRDEEVLKTKDYMAETTGPRTFPWRYFAIAEKDGELINNQLSYLLATPSKLDDTDWIKPGKVAWDWWNANNIYEVDFKAGINNETYKYYIDFASKYGIEYIILDEGWYRLGDLLDVVPAINVPELAEYGKEKNVGIILWVVWKTLDEQLVEALDTFEKWGVKGIKVDFMQRDDQWMVNYYEKIAREAAKRKLLVDFHGSYKPAGLHRTWPNVLTREGVRGLEQCKWTDKQTPEHDVTIPFIRMVAGPMDYTPGAMVNATEKNFRPIFNRPMSIGTRCHQLAMYVVYESPLQMMADNPSNYYREEECMDFLADVPVEWDETKVLHAEVGDYIVVARRQGDSWYIGGMTDGSAREFNLLFDFLDKDKTYRLTYYRDGVNAHRYASDYKRHSFNVKHGYNLQVLMAPGGGVAAKIVPLN